jgi:hypothetical protein
MAAGPNDWYDMFLLAETCSMSAGLTLLSDDELTRLRERIAGLTRTVSAEQRAMAADQLEAIDLELDRRLSVPPTQNGFPPTIQ